MIEAFICNKLHRVFMFSRFGSDAFSTCKRPLIELCGWDVYDVYDVQANAIRYIVTVGFKLHFKIVLITFSPNIIEANASHRAKNINAHVLMLENAVRLDQLTYGLLFAFENPLCANEKHYLLWHNFRIWNFDIVS